MKILKILLLLFAISNVNAQDFKCSYKRINDKIVEVYIKAKVGKNVKLYSITDKYSIYSFFSLDSVILLGPQMERGKVIYEIDKSLGVKGIRVRYAMDSLEWKQKIILDSKIKKTITGTITYLIKNESREFESDKVRFSLTIYPKNKVVITNEMVSKLDSINFGVLH